MSWKQSPGPVAERRKLDHLRQDKVDTCNRHGVPDRRVCNELFAVASVGRGLVLGYGRETLVPDDAGRHGARQTPTAPSVCVWTAPSDGQQLDDAR